MFNFSPDTAPDIETASDDYASRFSGAAGEFFLETQRRALFELLSDLPSQLNILEVGGGHGQLTEALLEAGHTVQVHGSAASCFDRLQNLKLKFPDHLSFVESSIFSVPAPGKSYDAVIAIRLLAHVPRWPEVVKELTRLARLAVVVDYAPSSGFNSLYSVLFSLKKSLEGNTRTFIRHSTSEIAAAFDDNSFVVSALRPQFFLPMVMHRKLNSARCSALIESLSASAGLTKLLGAPILAKALPR